MCYFNSFATGVGSRFLKAATATQYAIASLFAANEAVGFAMLIDPAGFQTTMTNLVGEDNAQLAIVAVTALNGVISFYSGTDLSGYHLISGAPPVPKVTLPHALDMSTLQFVARDAKIAEIELGISASGEKVMLI